MILKLAVASSLAFAGIAVPYFFIHSPMTDARSQSHVDANGKEAAQRKKGREPADSHASAILSCIAVSEAEYVTDVGREYDKLQGAFSRNRRLDIDPEIRRQIEHKKEIAESNCRREYDPPASPTP